MDFEGLQRGEWGQFWALYEEAFPPLERNPRCLVRHCARRGIYRLLGAKEGGELLGFWAVAVQKDLLLLDYLAVRREQRGRGLGSALLEELGRRYPGRRVILMLERPEAGSKNQEERLRRQRFYRKNGFAPTGGVVASANGPMELWSRGGFVSMEEYLGIQAYALGAFLFRRCGIRPSVSA